MKIITLYEAVQLLLDLVPDKPAFEQSALQAALEGVCRDGEATCNRVARLLAHELGVDVYESSWEAEEMGGLAFACVPRADGDPVPEELTCIDVGADWEVPTMRVIGAKLEPLDPTRAFDQKQAFEEGWGVFNDGEIQRNDEAGLLAGDDAAVKLVAHRALIEGSPYHLEALELAVKDARRKLCLSKS